MVGKHEFVKYTITFPLGTKDEMLRLDQLFVEDKFNPVADRQKPLSELLTIPLEKEKKREHKVSNHKRLTKRNGCMRIRQHIVYYLMLHLKVHVTV